MSISFALFWWAIRHEHMKIALTPAGARRAMIRFGAGDAAYLAAIGIAFASAPVSLLVGGLVAVYYAFEQTPARAPAPAERQQRPWPAKPLTPVRRARRLIALAGLSVIKCPRPKPVTPWLRGGDQQGDGQSGSSLASKPNLVPLNPA